MRSPNTNNAKRHGSWIAILPDKLRLTLRFRVQLFILGIAFLLLGANSAFAQVQTCAILTGGVAGQGIGVISRTLLWSCVTFQ